MHCPSTASQPFTTMPAAPADSWRARLLPLTWASVNMQSEVRIFQSYVLQELRKWCARTTASDASDGSRVGRAAGRRSHDSVHGVQEGQRCAWAHGVVGDLAAEC